MTLGITISILVEVGPHLLCHQFVIMDGSQINLLGRDLPEKLQAGFTYKNKGIVLELPEVMGLIMMTEKF